MERWGDGQGTHLTGAEHGEVHRRIEAAEAHIAGFWSSGASPPSS